MRVAHIITRLIVGGAQENTLFNVDDQHHLFHDDVCLITGPGLGPEGTLEQQALRRGLDLRVIPEMRRSLNPLQDWNSLRAIRALFRDYQPEIVHTHSSKAGILGRLAARQLHLPCVHTVHGASFHYGQNPLAHRIYRWSERRAARWCDHLITVCDAMTDQYVAAGVAERAKFTTIYSGMDVDRFLQPRRSPQDIRAEQQLHPGDIVFCKVARLFHLKGHNHLIDAAATVVRAVPNARFLLVGDGILRTEYERRLARLGLTSHFRLVGLVPPDAVTDYLHAADAIVHTSDWEGLARVLPQGSLAGKPLVTFDLDGAPEVCIPDQTGLLVPHRNVEQLAASMIRLAQDPGLRERLGAAGRERCRTVFRHEYMTTRVRQVYQSVLAARSRTKT
jgi:glycosyltransferase involved in cell wall biosynthesis